MLKSIVRWMLILGVLLVVGPLLARAAASLRDVDGGGAFTLLVGESPVKGAAIGAAACVAALVLGGIGARFYSLGTGYALAGVVFGWTAWSLGTIDAIIRRSHGSQDFILIAIEGGVLALAAAVIAAVLSKLAAAHHPSAANAPTLTGLAGVLMRDGDQKTAMATAVISLIAAAAGCGVAVWVVAASTMKGQTLFAAFIGGIAAGAAGNAAAGAKAHIRPVLPVVGMALLAVLGPIIAKFMHGSGVVEAAYADRLFALARPISLDWASGALLGVPVGMGWAGAVLDSRAIEQPA
ncbi:MAG: hypothetical protein JSR77_03960 [Planctomycetes bacterium]|nr:hypothetical protein [Planctomycetota bacterium]